MTPSKEVLYRISMADLRKLFHHFLQQKIVNIGPVVRDGVIMLDELRSFEDLPSGYYEDMGNGRYRLEKKEGDDSLFHYTLGPQSFKRFLNPPRRKLWSASKRDDQFEIHAQTDKPRNMAFWGVRSCDLKAFEILDKVFLEGSHLNTIYQKNRQSMWVIAVNCTHPSQNCFCHSMGSGPNNQKGFDLSITEIMDAEHHTFICEAGSERAHNLMEALHFQEADDDDIAAALKLIQIAKEVMNKVVNKEQAAHGLKNKLEHPEWDRIANICLSCANCTMVCPTCFCSTTEDITDITGDHTERWLRWDSCFNADFSFIHGGVIRNSIKSRYRQWLTHKMSAWHDQFGDSGCVGCGRCITWCPVGIDITKSVEALMHEEEK
jgi:ferredoxin